MRFLVLSSLCICTLAGCATTKSQAPDPTVAVELTLFEARTPDIVRGEKIHTAQQAVYIADLVVAMQGVNMRGRQAKVSFFEGLYLVTFSPGPDDPPRQYTVHIAATNSEVHSVRFEGRRLVASLKKVH